MTRGRPSAEMLAAVAATVLSAALVAGARHAHRQATPPDGVFAGSVAFLDDYLQYLSFAEQARDGAFLLRNKFDASPGARPALVNLTWWSAGALGRVTGWTLDTAFIAVGIGASFLLAATTGALLRVGGRAPRERVLGVVLVTAASGLGWTSLLLGGGLSVPPDAGMLLYPWAQALLAPHTTVGTALLLAGLLLWRQHEAGTRGPWPWIACATLLGLTRPFDLATLSGGVALSLAVQRVPVRRALPLLGVLPVLAYDAWIYGLHPSLGTYGSRQNVVPGPGTLAWLLALGLPAVAAVVALARPGAAAAAPVRRLLAATAAVNVALVALPVGFALQFSTSLAALLLALVAVTLPARVTVALIVLGLPGSLILADAARRTPPASLMPRDYAVVAEALAGRCRPGDVIVGPIDPSLYLAAHTRCHVLLGHRVLTPRYEERLEHVRRFYDNARPADEKRSWLSAETPRFVLAPPGGGEGLLAGSGYRALLRLPSLELWAADPG